MATIKLILTAKVALQQKYGADFNTLDGLLNGLIATDGAKSLQTQLFYLDDATSMGAAAMAPVDPSIPQNCKNVIDQLYQQYVPAYLVIFGAQDVIPFQILTNPTTDEDPNIPSDLPYACDSGYSTDISTFISPTRVVGRIPDIPGKGDINYATRVLNNLGAFNTQALSVYSNYFSISAVPWLQSSQLSLTNIFGNATQLLICPPDNASGNLPKLKSPSHFFNCHGANLDYSFYGQSGDNYPPAINTSDLNGNLSAGTLVAAECCYGAQLIDGNQTGNPLLLSIANNYFLNGAIGFMGSSTIAYGQFTVNDQADLITQFFFISTLAGASIGRALLDARQKYLSQSGPHIDPVALKTLGQFYLLGDPSLQPVLSQAADQKSVPLVDTVQNHRMELAEKGLGLGRTIIPAKKLTDKTVSKFSAQINAILKREEFQDSLEATYVAASTKNPGAPAGTQIQKSLFPSEIRFRTFMQRRGTGSTKAAIKNIRMLVLKESDNGLLGYKIYYSR